ncbi:hypothetical protein [Polluticoccus soli]|uniref:hypothetical protein n=1 Tax=Polluticoccus soli TaxID=3034150 RepID=UPI0023E1BC9D|nr:hypothetical protein [Flavipsychrobacter sp. JY13-12]
MTERTCRYCSLDYPLTKRGKHVFPKGLGGQDVYMDCVCGNCNQLFSTIERELIQKSLVGLMRSVEGLKGYARASDKQTPFKAQILLMADETNSYLYEVGQYLQMQVFVRAQVILYRDTFHIEADSEEGRNNLLKTYNSWKTTNLKMITRLPDKAGEDFEYVEFGLGSRVTAEKRKSEKAIKDAIIYLTLPSNHDLYPILSPRIFIDDDKKLRVRAKSEQEAIAFIEKLLTATMSKLVLHSFPGEINRQSIVNVGFSFDAFKFEQAMVKIGINCLIHYFREARNNTAIDDAIGFIMNGHPLIERRIDTKNSIIDSQPETHNIFFFQLERAFDVRVSMFNGSLIFAFSIPDLHLLKKGEYNRLVIDYKKHINKFETQGDFFASFK